MVASRDPMTLFSQRYFGIVGAGLLPHCLAYFERRQHCKPLLRPARQHDFVVLGSNPEERRPAAYKTGAKARAASPLFWNHDCPGWLWSQLSNGNAYRGRPQRRVGQTGRGQQISMEHARCASLF